LGIFGGGDGTRNEVSGDVVGTVIQAGQVNYYASAQAGEPEPVGPDDPWVHLAVTAEAWAHVRPDREVHDLRDRVAAVARGLAAVRDEAEEALADPWLDRSLPERFTKRVGWLLRQKLGTLVLDPAEAALLALTPLLHHALWSRAAARLSVVGPADLAFHAPGGVRSDYEKYLRENSRLLDRALMPDLRDRPNARVEIGWWLFNRWVRQHAELVKPPAIGALLGEVGVPDAGLAEVLSTERVRELLHGLRLEPQMLCGTDRLSRVAPQDTLYGGEPDEERVRGPLLGLVLGVANAASIPVTDLSDTVAWHLGIPGQVDLDRLHETLRNAKWATVADGLVLKAACQHGAVIEALREHVVRVDGLLDAVRRAAEKHAALDVLGRLPSRASAERVIAAESPDGKQEFSGWSRFSLDEQRVRELLMGEQLYRDRNLAIRELYQNALDACRYRSARERYLRRTANRFSDWEGLIVFTQGVDENDRPYIECSDNGVGMGEPELMGVFSRAGVRFADLAEFRDEQADWNSLDPPVELHPNSRFGIGVLSYFMLADEIVVTTCRMARGGDRPGSTLRATISGPGHLFQIEPIGEGGSPGTTVRLYLRSGERATCVQVLRQLLGIAEFRTVAEHGTEREQWEPGVFKARRRQLWEEGGIDAHGILVPAAGGRVIWCEYGGALLVDGLLTEPDLQHGVLAGPTGEAMFKGAVVNLTGRRAPRLSVDRLKIVDDVAVVVEKLLVEAIDELLGSPTAMPTLTWMASVGWCTPRLADLVGSRLTAASHPPADDRGWLIPPDAGRFPQDLRVVLSPDREVVGMVTVDDYLLDEQNGRPADHIYLWRVLANAPNPALRLLTDVVPDVADIGDLLRARPSDVGLVSSAFGRRTWHSDGQRLSPYEILTIALRSGSAPLEVASRLSTLGFVEGDVERFPNEVVPDRLDLGLVSNVVAELSSGRLEHSYAASPGQLLNGLFNVGLTMEEIAGRLSHHGFSLDAVRDIPTPPVPFDLVLVSRNLDGGSYWLAAGSRVPSAHLWWAEEKTGIRATEIGDRLSRYGFVVDDIAGEVDFDHRYDPVILSAGLRGGPQWLDRALPVPPGHVITAAAVLDQPVAVIVERLARHGYRVSEPLAARPTREDEVLLSVDLDGTPPWLTPGEPVRSHHVARYTRVVNATADEAVARLTAYGFEVDAAAAETTSTDDLILLSRALDGAAPWLRPDVRVPLMHLVEAAAKLSTTIAQVTDRLRVLGVAIPDPAVTIREAMRRVPREPR
jgi:hypothetical protein